MMVVSNVALVLDWVLYPRFRHRRLKIVFVVSLPRTAYQPLHALNAPGMPFTSMKLWENTVAPRVRKPRWWWKRLPSSLKKAFGAWMKKCSTP